MKIPKSKLKRIIREEHNKIQRSKKAKVLKEMHDGAMMDLDDHNRLVQDIDSIIMRMTHDRNGPTGYTREDIIYTLKNILEEI